MVWWEQTDFVHKNAIHALFKMEQQELDGWWDLLRDN
jgi:hypothetical protein